MFQTYTSTAPGATPVASGPKLYQLVRDALVNWDAFVILDSAGVEVASRTARDAPLQIDPFERNQ